MAELIVVGRIELVESAGMRGIRGIRRARRILILRFHIERSVPDLPTAAQLGHPGARAQVRGTNLSPLQRTFHAIFDPARHRPRHPEAERVNTKFIGAVLTGAAGKPTRSEEHTSELQSLRHL